MTQKCCQLLGTPVVGVRRALSDAATIGLPSAFGSQPTCRAYGATSINLLAGGMQQIKAFRNVSPTYHAADRSGWAWQPALSPATTVANGLWASFLSTRAAEDPQRSLVPGASD